MRQNLWKPLFVSIFQISCLFRGCNRVPDITTRGAIRRRRLRRRRPVDVEPADAAVAAFGVRRRRGACMPTIFRFARPVRFFADAEPSGRAWCGAPLAALPRPFGATQLGPLPFPPLLPFSPTRPNDAAHSPLGPGFWDPHPRRRSSGPAQDRAGLRRRDRVVQPRGERESGLRIGAG